VELAATPIATLTQHPKWKKFVAAVADSDNNPPATRYYYHYKQTAHSANYDIRTNSFIENILLKSKGQVRLTTAQGDKYLEGYHSLIPEIRGYYHPWVASQYEKSGVVYNLFGYPLALTKKLFEHEYTKIYDKVPQSTVGCITHIAFTNIFNYIRDNKLPWAIIQNNHDSYLGQCPIADKMHMAAKMKEFMEIELVSPFGERFRMRSETQTGFNWGVRKEKKDKLTGEILSVYNPEGLVELKF
jgi:hypothetical protein